MEYSDLVVYNGTCRVEEYVRSIFQAYVTKYPQKVWPYMVQYLNMTILMFQLK